MTEKVVLRWKYQVVIHRRNKRLHRLIDIVGIVWNHALAQQSRYYRLTDGYIGKYTMSSLPAEATQTLAALSVLAAAQLASNQRCL